MSKKKEVLVRMAFSDIVMSKGDADKISNIIMTDDENEYINDVECYTAGYEFEDGEECNEDGTEL